ncbi:MAG: ComEC/Rec2 family competence protein [Anaerolineae bacterium]|nr:ComEC/Rec2 family competence protein [Anaerolineae bacterium]
MTLVWLIIAWATGIWLARWAWSLGVVSCDAPGPLVWAGLLALPALALILSRNRRAWRLPAAAILLLLLGALRFQLSPFLPCFSPTDLAFHNGSLDNPTWTTVTGVMVKPPEARDTRVRIRLRAESLTLANQGDPLPVDGDALLTVDRALGLRYGDRIAVHGRLEDAPVFEDFDYREYLARQGVHTLVQQPQVTVLGHGYGHRFWEALYRFRDHAQAVIARLLPEPESGLLTGILLGVETGIDPALYDMFNRTGVSHIIVISGFNITIVAGLLTAIFARLIGGKRAFWPVIGGIILYTLLVGADAAVVRAAIMGVLVALAVYLNRRSTAAVSLFVAGFLMTLLNPLTLWDVGFELSFIATLSLVMFATPMTQWFEARVNARLPSSVARTATGFLNDALIVTLAATILTLPLIAFYFGRVSVVSPLTNLLVLPVQPYVMIWGGLGTILGLIGESLNALWLAAQAAMTIPFLALHWTVAVVEALAPLPFASVNVDLGRAGLWVFYLALGGIVLTLRSNTPVLGKVRQALTSSTATTLSAAALLVVGGLLFVSLRTQPDGKLHVHFLDSERGEAVLIETPDGQQVLIDGGYSPTALLGALGRHMPFYDRKLELVVLTHPGDERVGGLVGLPERYQIDQVLQAPFPYPSTAYESWLRLLQRQQIPVTRAEAGTRVLLGNGIALDVLHPGPDPTLTGDGEPDLDANSLVLRLSWGDTSFLLTGDASDDVQDALVASGVDLRSTVVKLPDGGRQASFSQPLLDAVQAQQAVVFVQSDDRFRQLSGAVQDAWVEVVGEENFHRTDLEGTVSFTSNGKEVWRDSR